MISCEKEALVSMFENSSLPFGIIQVVLDGSGRPADWAFLCCNQAMEALAQRTSGELVSHSFFELLPNGDHGWMEPYYEAAFCKKAAEWEIKSEEIGVHLHVDCLPIEDEGQCALIMRNTWKEDTYRQELEEQLISFRNIHKSMASGAWHLTFDTQWKRASVKWSNTMRQMLGFRSEEDFPNTFQAWAERIHPDDKAYILKNFESVAADTSGKKPFDVEYRMRHKDGTYHWFHTTGGLSRRADGSPQFFDGLFINIDKQHETRERFQNALQESQRARKAAQLDHEIVSAVSRLYLSVFMIDLERDYYEEISSNITVHHLTGYGGKAQQKLDELCMAIVDPEYRDSARQFFDLSTVAERLADTDMIELEYLVRDGNWYASRFIEKKRDDSGHVTDILCATRIISKEKQKELERQELKIAYQASEKANEAKTAFLLNMSHDIRTPMNAILGYAQLMRKELPDDPKLLHYQEMIEESGNLLLAIINNVLDMTKIESGALEIDENYNHVGDIISKIVTVFQGEAKKKGLKLTKELHVQNFGIMCDVTKLQEVFTNLISNAIKYTPPGESVTISVDELPCTQPGYVTLRTVVADTGIGISEEFQSYLFEPFTRERNTTLGKVLGTGLGMSIVKSLVELMGGTIKVESELGKGTKCIVTLTHKLADQTYYDSDATQKPDEAAQSFAGKRLLLAEDNDLNAEIAIAILEDLGFAVDRAVDGVDCVNRYQREAAGSYDLILMDIQMPNMDGYKATLAIRRMPDREKAGIPIVAMTANAFAEDRQKAFSVGMNGHISKPINPKTLRDTLQKLF